MPRTMRIIIPKIMEIKISIARGLQTDPIKITAIREMMAAQKSGKIVSADMAQDAASFSAFCEYC